MVKAICNVPGSLELLEALTRVIIGTRTGSMIDVCCGEAHITKKLNQFQTRVAVDVQERFPDAPGVQFYVADIFKEHHIFDNRYDVSICHDAIEHFSKEEGRYLMRLIENISDVCMFFTPMQGFDSDIDYEPQKASHTVKEATGVEYPDCHKSGWLPHEFEKTDYAVLEFPCWHGEMGAFVFWRSSDTMDEFNRACELLMPYGVTRIVS